MNLIILIMNLMKLIMNLIKLIKLKLILRQKKYQNENTQVIDFDALKNLLFFN